MHGLQTPLKFICVIILGFALHLLIEVSSMLLLDIVVFLEPFSFPGRSVLYTLLLIPALAWRAISDPAGKLAYLPALLVPAMFPFIFIAFSSDMGIFSSYTDRWALFLSTLIESMSGICGNIVILWYGGNYIYNSRRS